MPLSAGDKVGPYEILAPLGAGGMGEVYRARDSKLNREVALKVLPDSFACDRDRMVRFTREAQVLASLNHPNIATIYGMEEQALVMELVDGATLAQRLARGPIPASEAAPIARQMAEALEYAHERGIVHRDLKPANIKIASDGRVKLLDFGLAKAMDSPHAAASDPENSPTVTVAGTAVGVTLGTAGYMAPEQARGEAVDRRADIWAFGAVVFEMLTGRQVFVRKSTVESLAAVVRDDPPWPDLPHDTPAPVTRLLRRCLEKDPKRRLRDIGEARIVLEEDATGDGEGRATAPRTNWLPWGVAAVALAIAATAGIAWMRTSPPTVTERGVALSLVPPSGIQLTPPGSLSVDRISPDGSMVLFRASDNRFHTRRLSSHDTETLPDWRWGGDAFWAPDSGSIAFPTLDIVRLMKMRLPRGVQEVVCDIPGSFRGGSWGEKGDIIFAIADRGLIHATAAGGQPARLEVPGLPEGSYYGPEFLPGGKDFLFVFAPAASQEAQVYLATLNGSRAEYPTLLLRNDTAVAFTPAGGGRLLFVRNDNLYSQALDLRARKLGGDAELLQERVATYAGSRSAYFSVSRNGTVIWRSGTAVASQATVFDRKGNQLGIAGSPAPASRIALAPDESRLIVVSEAGAWVVDSHGPGRVPLSPNVNERLFWSADSSRVLFRRDGKVWEIPSDGSGQTREFTGNLPAGNSAPQLAGGERSDNMALSPDASWVVYSPRNGYALNAQPVNSTTVPHQIAPSGSYPVWRRDGKEILYIDRDKLTLMSVRVEGSGEDLRFGSPEMLFRVGLPLGTNSGSKPVAVSRDGSRIYVLQSTDESESGVIQVRTGAIR
jgi:eukaryotic-like serine/threonine-protein kinase